MYLQNSGLANASIDQVMLLFCYICSLGNDGCSTFKRFRRMCREYKYLGEIHGCLVELMLAYMRLQDSTET